MKAGEEEGGVCIMQNEHQGRKQHFVGVRVCPYTCSLLRVATVATAAAAAMIKCIVVCKGVQDCQCMAEALAY
jgi:hypothetical protein